MSSKSNRKRKNQRQFTESFIIIWLDQVENSNTQRMETLKKFQTIINTVLLFTDVDECVNYLTDLSDVHVMLILSFLLDRSIVSQIVSLPVISKIYVLYSMDNEGLQLNRKFQTVDSDSVKLTQLISSDVHRLENELMEFEVVSTSDLNATLSNNPNSQDFAFLYSILLKDVLLKFTDDNTTEMVTYWRNIYHDNLGQQKFIDEFECNYTAYQAIWWYTRETSLYTIVNRALRTRDAKALYLMRTYIRHLHEHLTEISSMNNTRSELPQSMRLYRGQRMSYDELERVKAKVGGLMSVSNFLSTTTDENIARIYADKSDKETAGVLMEIIIDQTMMRNSLFACIEHFSHFEQGENEWLFSMGTVFHIEQVECHDQIWHLRLCLTNDQDENIVKLIGHFRKNIQLSRPNPLVPLCRLFARMDEYDSALEICQKHRNSEQAWEIDATMFDTLALQSDDKGHGNAPTLLYHQTALDTMTEHVPHDDPILASYYSNLAISLSAMNHDEEAVKAYQKSIELELKDPQPDNITIAYSYDAMATILHYILEDYDLALEYSQRAFDLMIRYLPSRHDDLLALYENMADIYKAKNQEKEALELLYECLEKQETPPERSIHDRARTYRRIAELHEAQGNFTKAAEMMQKCEELEAMDPVRDQIDWNKLNINSL